MTAARLRPLLVPAVLAAATGVVLFRTLGTASNYDEGVYLASVDALRHGDRLGTDVFASQPPGFYILLRAVEVVVGSSLGAVRAGLGVVWLAGCIASFALARSLGGLAAGVGAAAAVGTAPILLSYGARVEADPPSVAFALIALALAARGFRRGTHPGWIVGAGAVFACAVSVKLLVVPVVVPLAALAVYRRTSLRRVGLFALGMLAVAVPFAAAYAGTLPALWHDIVSFQLDSSRASGGSIRDRAHVLRVAVTSRELWSALVGLGVVCSIVLAARRRATGAIPLLAFAAAACVFLLYRNPLAQHDLVLWTVSVALAGGFGLGIALAWLADTPAAATAVAAVGAAAVMAMLVHSDRALSRQPHGEPEWQQWAAVQLARRSDADDRVLTDYPMVAHLAGRLLPGNLVDSSMARVRAGSLTARDVAAAIDRDRIHVAAIGRAFYADPGTRTMIEHRFRHHHAHEFIVLYTEPR